jgi:hypothetical protein
VVYNLYLYPREKLSSQSNDAVHAFIPFESVNVTLVHNHFLPFVLLFTTSSIFNLPVDECLLKKVLTGEIVAFMFSQFPVD